MSSPPVRDQFGRWKSGFTGNPLGRLPKAVEMEYLDVTWRTVSPEKWGEVMAMALDDCTHDNPHVRARAREWVGKYVLGDPSAVQQLLYRDERKFEIVVTFGDNGHRNLLEEGDIVDVEPVVAEAD